MGQPLKAASILIGFLLIVACEQDVAKKPETVVDLKLSPAKVQVSKASGTWKVYKDGEPFFIKGVAGGQYYDRITEFGGNTLRTYGINDSTMVIMDRAHEFGLSVAFGLWLQQPEYGFDYTDSVKVQEQLAMLTQQVREYKDHPALLFWILGNELDGHYEDNENKQAMWEAVNQVSEMIHREDLDHPTTIAIINASVEKLLDMQKWAPDLDFFSSNAKYPQTGLVVPHLQEAGWDIGFILSEFGNRALPKGFPESPVLPWGALVEPTSTEKAQIIDEIYNEDVTPNIAYGCMGSFAFLWGDQAFHQSGSRRNWHSFFNEDGYTYGMVDVLQYGWTGIYPDNRAPVITDRTEFLLNGKQAFDGVTLELNETYMAVVNAEDTDPLSYEWVVVEQGASLGSRPPGLPGWLLTDNGRNAEIKAINTGQYRLYVFVKDSFGKVANAVIPFIVE